MIKLRRPWSLAEYEQASSLHDAGMTYYAIGRRLGRPGAGVQLRLEAGPPKVFVGAGDHQVHAARVSEQQMQDRDRRQIAAHGHDLTGAFCGDPPPGYSALDRKQP